MQKIYKFGDVVEVEIPFTDLSDKKLRPAVVVSTEKYCKELKQIIVMAITGSTWGEGIHFGTLEVLDLEEAGLKKPSVIKSILYSVHVDKVQRKRGSVDKTTRANIQKMLRQILP